MTVYMSIVNIARLNARRAIFVVLIGLSTACSVDDNNEVSSTTGLSGDSPYTSLSGSVGDGPVTQAEVVVTDNDGTVLVESISDSTANYNVSVPANSSYPLIITASGGTDMVTGVEPDFALVSVAMSSFDRTVNINPFSTLIVKTAQAMDGGLTTLNLSLATQYTFDQLNFGLDLTLVPNPITSTINEMNVAAIIKASEALGEVIRRTQSALLIAGVNVSGDDIIDMIAADMVDGILDGRGSNADARISATANIVSAQVLVELIANRLNVSGADATMLMDSAINLSMPGATMQTSDVVITEDVLTQARVAVAAAQSVNSNSNLAAVAVILASLTGNSLAADIQADLPSDANTVFDEVIRQVVLADSGQLESVNASVRTGSTTVLPPPQTTPPAPEPIPEPAQSPGTFEFSVSTYSVGENDGFVAITINRIGGSDGEVTVDWRTQGVSATFAQDYGNFSWTPLVFTNGETSKVETISIVSDSLVEGDETFNVLLGNPTGGAILGSITEVPVTIIDDDSVSSNSAPVITLTGSNPMTLLVGDTYIEPGATATDDVDGNISSAIVIDSSAVNTANAGTYSVSYNVSDSSGNAANTVFRTVNVVNSTSDRPWENLVNDIVGFGSNTTGGLGGDVCWVTSLNDSGSGTLRACAESNNTYWIRFQVAGTINLTSPLFVSSNKTIDGRDNNITIAGYGLRLHGVDNVIIHNVEFRGGVGSIGDNSLNNDAIQIWRGSSNIWIDHVSASNWPDELVDVSHASTDITMSWNRFFHEGSGRGYGVLIGSAPNQTGDVNIRITLHHNYFERLSQRLPRIRFAKIHSYNNYFYDWSAYATWASQLSQVRSESNIFEAVRSTDALKATPAGSDPDPGEARDDNSWVIGGAVILERNPQNVFNPASSYNYQVDSADASLRTRIINEAGVVRR